MSTLLIGIDCPKENLAGCAIDERGWKRAEAVFPNTATGHRSLLSWARGLGSVERIGIEGAGQYNMHRRPCRILDLRR